MSRAPLPGEDTFPLTCVECGKVHRYDPSVCSVFGLEEHVFTCPSRPDTTMSVYFCDECGWTLLSATTEEGGGNVLLQEGATIEDGE